MADNDNGGAQERSIRKIAILGGGVAGWLAAAALGQVLRRTAAITVIETAEVPLESETGTLSQLGELHGMIGIKEPDLVRRTGASFRLGGEFRDWGKPGDVYFNPLGELGAVLDAVAFRHHWLRLKQSADVGALSDYSLCAVAARSAKFMLPTADKRSVLSTLAYGLHIDTARYADYLAAIAQALGVARIEGKIADAELRAQDGFVEAIRLSDGQRIDADLFLDCTGELVGEQLDNRFADWRQWLACDRVVSISSESSAELPSATRSTAHGEGWQWRIALPQRTGNGYVYASGHLSDDEAAAQLLAHLDGKPVGEPRSARFLSGRREKFWDGNVVAIGPAACVLDPLECTSVHLAQTGIMRLLSLFPDRDFQPGSRAEYNRLMINEAERLRDFLILHYKAGARNDTAFWRDCRAMEVPEPLAYKIKLFESRGRIVMYDEETFQEQNWAAVFLGQGVMPRRYDPLADASDPDRMKMQLDRMRAIFANAAQQMPPHRLFIEKLAAGT